MGFVCVVGSINLDTLVRLQRLPEIGETILGQPLGSRPGGKGFNQAVAAVRCGAPTRFCAQIGDDFQGEILRREIDHAGLEARVHISPGVATGSAYIAMLSDSDNSIIVAPGANAVALIEIDGELPEPVLAKVRALPQVQSAKPLHF